MSSSGDKSFQQIEELSHAVQLGPLDGCFSKVDASIWSSRCAKSYPPTDTFRY